jgi:hypothetical protein
LTVSNFVDNQHADDERGVMTSGELADLLSKQLSIPFSTVDLYGRHLRDAGLLTVKGRGRGAAAMTPLDAAYWLIALCINHRRGGEFAKEVTRVANLPQAKFTVRPRTLIRRLQFPHSKNAVSALAALMTDILSDRYAELMASRDRGIYVIFDAEGEFMTIFCGNNKPLDTDEAEEGVWNYERITSTEKKPRNLEYSAALHGLVLWKIAKAMDLMPPHGGAAC